MSILPAHNPESSDEELIARSRSGDREAFTALYLRHAPRVLTLLKARYEPNLAEDLLQEAFLRAWLNLDGFLSGTFVGWVFRIAQNAGLDHHRRRGPIFQGDLTAEQEPVQPQHDEEEILQRQRRLQHCLDQLNEQQRALIYNKFGGEEDHETLCSRLGISADNGYKIRHRAMKELDECAHREQA